MGRGRHGRRDEEDGRLGASMPKFSGSGTSTAGPMYSTSPWQDAHLLQHDTILHGGLEIGMVVRIAMDATTGLSQVDGKRWLRTECFVSPAQHVVVRERCPFGTRAGTSGAVHPC